MRPPSPFPNGGRSHIPPNAARILYLTNLMIFIFADPMSKQSFIIFHKKIRFVVFFLKKSWLVSRISPLLVDVLRCDFF